MQSVMMGVSVVYFILVANFYNESHGFTMLYNDYYAMWKVSPLFFLIVFALVHGGGMSTSRRLGAAAGLLFGAMGDYLILFENGIVYGAIAFGIGHIFYMSLFVGNGTSLHSPSLLVVVVVNLLVGYFCLLPILAIEPIAVLILAVYALFLSGALVIALSQWINRNVDIDAEPLLYRAIGFGLFFCSDNMLIVHHTGYPLPMSELLVLGSYYSAQLFIFFSFIVQYNPLALPKQLK